LLRLVVVSVVLGLVLVPFPPIGWATATGELVVPNIRAGDRANYSGQVGLGFKVEGRHEIEDRAGRTVDAIKIAIIRADGREEDHFLSVESARLEKVDRKCSVRDSSGCLPWTQASWFEQGLPDLFGATLLQGRSFSVGDAWDVSGACYLCNQAIHVSIESPNETSPAGTSFVAVVTQRLSTNPDSGLWGSMRLSMTTELAYPLQVITPRGIERLAAFSSGASLLSITDDVDPYYPPLAEVVPPEGDLPPEGDPPLGFPSWREARVLPGRLGSLTIAPVTALEYYFLDTTPISTLHARDHIFRAHTPSSSEVDDVTTYKATQLGSAPRAWQISLATEPQWFSPACTNSMVPMWDAVKLGIAAQAPGTFSGFIGLFGCQYPQVVVLGAAHEWNTEQVVIDLHNGHKVSTLMWRGDT
jgi:hypothetical protein